MKKIVMAAMGLIMAVVLAGCNTPAQPFAYVNCPSGLAVMQNGTEIHCLVDKTNSAVPAASGNVVDTAPKAEPAAPAADAPAPVADKAADAAPASKPAVPSNAGQTASCSDVDFTSYVGRPYDLIAMLDVQSGKVPQSSPNYTLVAESNLLYWTGAYTGGQWPSGFVPLVVDGQTGVFCVPSGTTATVNFVGAWMNLEGFNSAATPNQVDDEPGAACMPAAAMAQLLNDVGQSDPERFFRSLDEATNVEGAEFLAARWRPEPLGPKVYENLISGANVFWLQENQVSGVQGKDFVLLVASGGKWAVLNLDSTLSLNYAHTGVKLCEGLDLAKLVTWWGK